jgi:hypothetical protein
MLAHFQKRWAALRGRPTSLARLKKFVGRRSIDLRHPERLACFAMNFAARQADIAQGLIAQELQLVT